MIFNYNIVKKMFIIGDWILSGVISIVFGDLLICFGKDDQFKVV